MPNSSRGQVPRVDCGTEASSLAASVMLLVEVRQKFGMMDCFFSKPRSPEGYSLPVPPEVLEACQCQQIMRPSV